MNLQYSNYFDKSVLDDLNISYKIDNSNITLTSTIIHTLPDFLRIYHNNKPNYELGIKALKDFCIQIKNFQDRRFTFLSFDESSIFVIDYTKFLILPHENFKLDIIDYHVDSNKLKVLLNNTPYIPPELLEIKNNIIHIATCYYSIGLLLLKITFNDINTNNLNSIKYTPLFNSIKRCLQINPKHRYLVLV